MVRYPIVLFDVGRTLIGPRESYGAVYRQVLRELGLDLPLGPLDRAIADASADVARRVPPGRDRFAFLGGGEAGFWRRFVADVLERASGRRADEASVRRALDGLWDAFGHAAAWRVFDDVVPALAALRRAGARLAVVSNWDSRLPRLLERLDLAGFFDAMAVSHLEGLEKPDPRLFHRALERLDAAPRQALHVGDVPELDVAGARAAGIDAVLLDRAGQADAHEGVLRDLRDLPPLVARGLPRGRSAGRA